MPQVDGTFLEQFIGFSGPAQAIIDNGLAGEMLLPETDGNASISMNEGTVEVIFDSTGNTPRDVFAVGQRLEVSYPMAIANLEAFVLAMSGNNYTLGDTTDPTGYVSGQPETASFAITARKSATPTKNRVHKKTQFTFDMWRVSEPLFDSDGDAVTRTVNSDKWGLHLDAAVAMMANGEFQSFNITGNDAYTMSILGVLPAIDDTYYRVFNTDLALA